VTIHHGRIQSIFSKASAPPPTGPTAVQRLDGTNLYLIPGLIDSHVRLGGIPGMTGEQEEAHPDIALAARDQFPRSYLYSGFTTVIDLISTPEEMARWKSYDPAPDTYFCGGAVLMDGHPSNYLPRERPMRQCLTSLWKRGHAAPPWQPVSTRHRPWLPT
jgi:hypothetical protein